LYSSSTFKFYGEILLRQEGEYTSVTGELTGLPRNARLGIHVHEFGNFSDPVNMCLSTGSHFNPFGVKKKVFFNVSLLAANGLLKFNFYLYL